MRKRCLVPLVVAVGLSSSAHAQIESVPDAVKRIDAKVQELERRGTGKRGPAGPPGPRGPKGEPGLAAKIGDFESLLIGGGRVFLTVRDDGNGQLALFDEENNIRVSLDGGAYLQIRNEDKKSLVFLGQYSDSKEGGLIIFNPKNGDRAVELGSIGAGGRGQIRVNGTKVHDYAELFELTTREGIRPGSVVAYDPDSGGVLPASASNARLAIGVISGAGGLIPGMVIGSRKDGSRDFPVSMSGVIHVRVSDEAGPVKPGDLLVPSSVAGVGMRAGDPAAAAGTVFGKALGSWSDPGEGLVPMLVMNR